MNLYGENSCTLLIVLIFSSFIREPIPFKHYKKVLTTIRCFDIIILFFIKHVL